MTIGKCVFSPPRGQTVWPLSTHRSVTAGARGAPRGRGVDLRVERRARERARGGGVLARSGRSGRTTVDASFPLRLASDQTERHATSTFLVPYPSDANTRRDASPRAARSRRRAPARRRRRPPATGARPRRPAAASRSRAAARTSLLFEHGGAAAHIIYIYMCIYIYNIIYVYIYIIYKYYICIYINIRGGGRCLDRGPRRVTATPLQAHAPKHDAPAAPSATASDAPPQTEASGSIQ